MLTATSLGVLVVFAGCASRKDSADPPPANAGQAHLQQAVMLLDSGSVEAALAEFEAAIAENPQLTVAYLGAADIYRQQGDYASAERRYGEAAKLEPRSFEAQYGHGLMLQLLGRAAEAVRAYLRALDIRPNDAEVNLNLATAYLQVGEARQALPFAQRAVELSPGSGPARVNLGAVYTALGMHDNAVVEYQQAAELMQLTPPLLMNLADSLGRSGRHAEMASTLERLIQTDDSALARERLGAAYFHLRRFEDAIASFRRALEIDPEHYPGLNGIGVCYLNKYVASGYEDQESLRRAREALRHSLRIRPGQASVIDLLARYR